MLLVRNDELNSRFLGERLLVLATGGVYGDLGGMDENAGLKWMLDCTFVMMELPMPEIRSTRVCSDLDGKRPVMSFIEEEVHCRPANKVCCLEMLNITTCN